MCGFAGTVGVTDPSVCEAMSAKIAHRGPDDHGFRFFSDDVVALGFRRLAIIDLLDRANQPMSNEEGTVWVVFNGEIYNFVEQRDLLTKRGRRFSTESDTETLLHLYEEYGEGFLQHLNGMFAFALFDTKLQRLYLVRDRLGIKPLYYWSDGSRIAFASEIKALLEAPFVDRDVNWQGISDYLTYLYVPGPATAFRGIHEVPPGHAMTIDLKSGTERIHAYWELGKADSGTHDHPRERLRHLLDDAVRLQMVSDVPLGIFLSGGIDSTILTGLASQTLSEPVKTFTVVFHGKDLQFFNEDANARDVAEYYSTEHHEIPVSIGDPAGLLDLLHHMDQPFGNPTYYLNYLVSKIAREHVTVGLAGAGGDELFAGYPRYRAMRLARTYGRIPKWGRRLIAQALSGLRDDYRSMRTRRIREFVNGIDQDPVRQFINFTYFMSDSAKKDLWGPAFSSGSLLSADRVIRDRFERSPFDGDNRFLDVDVNTFLPWNILEYTDRMSMAVGLEARVPYLDHRVVEFALRAPFETKLQGRQTKVVLREACADLLPPEVRDAPKRGFNLPLAMWMRDRLDSYFDINMTRGQVEDLGIFRWETLRELRLQHRHGRRDNSSELFSIIAFDMWFRRAILSEDTQPITALPPTSFAKAV